MPDRGKVIKELEEAEIMLTQAVDRGGEMAVMGAFKCLNCVTDALALLKKQEVIEPILKREGRNKYYNYYVCPRCDEEVVYDQNYCPECGAKFMWEGR